MSRPHYIVLVALSVTALAVSAGAQDLSGENMKSLDGQVQEIKSDVLNIASELSNLEERLLYPSGTQLAIFVAVAEERPFRLDELEALQEGGVQRAYTGNVVTGSHELRVTMIGKTDNGKDFTETDTFSFSKDVKPATLGITLAGPGLGGDEIRIGSW